MSHKAALPNLCFPDPTWQCLLLSLLLLPNHRCSGCLVGINLLQCGPKHRAQQLRHGRSRGQGATGYCCLHS